MFKTKQSRAVAGGAATALVVALLAGALLIGGAPARRAWRQSRMQRAASAHYLVMASPRLASSQALERFASGREAVFAPLDSKLGARASDARIKIIFDEHFDEEFAPDPETAGAPREYEVLGAEIRAKPSGTTLELDPAADAAAILHAVWGRPASPVIARWAAIGLTGQWRGEDLGIAAARVAQKFGHQTIAALVQPAIEAPPAGSPSPAGPPSALLAPLSEQDRALMGGAWMSAVAELGGAAAAHKLYSKLPAPDPVEAANLLGTTPAELERTWQMWIYAHLIGLPLPAPPTVHDHAH